MTEGTKKKCLSNNTNLFEASLHQTWDFAFIHLLSGFMETEALGTDLWQMSQRVLIKT